jgi:hypothetical protein
MSRFRFATALVMFGVLVACDSQPPAGPMGGVSVTRESVRDAAAKVDFSLVGSIHNRGMRLFAERLLGSGHVSKLESTCRALSSVFEDRASIDARLSEAAPVLQQLQLSQRVLTSPLAKLVARSATALEQCEPSSRPANVAYDPPIPLLTLEAQDLLYRLSTDAADAPGLSVYFARTNAVRQDAASLDSVEYALVLASAEIADSSYANWNSSMAPIVTAAMDGSESGPCTTSGLEDGTFGRVVGSDVAGAIGGAFAVLVQPTSWVGGLWSAAGADAVGGGVGAVGSSASAIAMEVMNHRRKRC